MLPLILRLSQLDADAAGALRVVSFFDALVTRRAGLDAVVRSTAGLAECAAGLRDDATGRVVRHDPRHTPPRGSGSGPSATPPRGASATMSPGPSTDPSAGPPGGVPTHEVLLDGFRVGTVWLERTRDPGPLDAMVLERMALAVAALWPGGPELSLADPALVELAVSITTADADRARALRLLGFAPGVTVRAVAVRGDDPQTTAADLVRSLGTATDGSPRPGSGLSRAALIAAGEAAIVVQDDLDNQDDQDTYTGPVLPDGARVGIGCRVGTDGLGTSWRQARTATRFAGILGRPAAVRYADLGALSALADVPSATIETDPDVRRLRRLAADPAGRRDLTVLEAYLATGSQRHAATALHRHHSSVSRRLEALMTGWGLDLERPQDRMRAETAFVLYAISTGRAGSISAIPPTT